MILEVLYLNIYIELSKIVLYIYFYKLSSMNNRSFNLLYKMSITNDNDFILTVQYLRSD